MRGGRSVRLRSPGLFFFCISRASSPRPGLPAVKPLVFLFLCHFSKFLLPSFPFHPKMGKVQVGSKRQRGQ